MSDEKDGFKVSDRRKFNPDGTPREQSPDRIEPLQSINHNRTNRSSRNSLPLRPPRQRTLLSR